MKNGRCIMDGHFPNYDTHFVIDSSDDDGEIERSKPFDEDVKKCFDIALNLVFEDNRDLIKKQGQLCNDYLDTELENCEKTADEIDALIIEVEEQLNFIKHELYDPYKPVVTEVESVDINCEEVAPNKIEKVYPIGKSILKNTGIETNKNNKKEEDDKEDVIAVDRTVCTIPADLPKEGPLEYPLLQEGQVVYAMKISLIQPWYKCKIKAVINNDYVHIKFDNDEKLLTTKEIAYYTPNSVQFPIGARVIAKFTDTDSKVIDYFYAGVIAEPPKLLNQFR